MEKLTRFLRSYLLLLAIGGGTLTFFAFHLLPFLAPLKPAAYFVGGDVLPWLIFVILFFSFCKVNPREMTPHYWQAYLLLIQLAACGILVYFICQENAFNAVLLEGALICVISPTAAAAAVITGKLGGNDSEVVAFTLADNLFSAITIPLLFPLFLTSIQGGFLDQFLLLMGKVFPVIVLPMVLAFTVRYCFKGIHHFIVTRLKDAGFYLWGVSLTVVSSRAVAGIVNSPESAHTIWLLVLIGLLATVLQFGLGKAIAHPFGKRVSGGQAFGQRNGVFALWVALTYLNPTAAIAPGSYILWQNLVNGVQMWHRGRLIARAQQNHTELYQE